MKAFLLAAGHGTRLSPYTDTVPKCLLPICGVPLLKTWLELCHRYGISHVLVNTHAHSDLVADFVRNWSNGVHVTVAEEPELYGSAGTLSVNRNWVQSEEGFWVFYADVLTNINLDAMQAFHDRNCAATIGVYPVPDPERCGIVELDAGSNVLSFIEKPSAPRSNLAFAGILLGTQRLLEAIPDKSTADIGFDVLPRLIGSMRAYSIPEFVLDIGTRNNYELAQTVWPVIQSEATHVLGPE